MKKLFLFLLVIFTCISILSSCNKLEDIVGNNDKIQNSDQEKDDTTDLTPSDDEKYVYEKFSGVETSLFRNYLGTTIPFLPTNQYDISGYDDSSDYDSGIHYYTVGNTEKEFNNYRSLYSDFTFVGTYEDSNGITWYRYENELIIVKMAFSHSHGNDYVDVYVCKNDASQNDPDNGGNGGNNSGNTSKYTYNDFTSEEKTVFSNLLGEVIPFIPNDEYYVEEGYDEYLGMDCVSFYTVGNTQDDFNEYLKKFSSYTLSDTYEDSYGDTWYCYEKGDIYIELSYYYYEGYYLVDLYAYNLADSGNSGSGSGGNSGSNDGSHAYTDFASSEKSQFVSLLGESIPFIPNDDYYIEEGYDEYMESDCINFYTFGNTQAEFDSYLKTFTGYTLVDTYEDEYGDTWYCYEKGSIYIEVAFYYYDSSYVVDLYAYNLDGISSGSGSGSGSGSSSGSGGSSSNQDVITNAGAGLPQGTNGVYDIDFTDATIVKDVTDQGYYLDGCPTTGSPAVLVIPVEFSDVTALSKGYSISKIQTAFYGSTGTTDYFSVDEYYYLSSGGKLDLDITVLDSWFRPSQNSSYYKNATYDYYGDEVSIGDQLIIDEALDYLDDYMDLSIFDSDNNGIIDAIVLITTLEINDSSDFNWAYRYWNIYTDDQGYYYEYDGVSANDYLWASYQFMFESYDESGNSYYGDTDVMNTYTYIHEFGHILGIDDYYDTAYEENPLDGCDVMDAMTGDHNAYTKFNMGWITSSRLVTTTSSVTLTLDAFSKNGDTIIIANNFDPTLGVYQEYYIVVYYTMEGLNGGDYGYFARDGIIVYHVNASLYKEIYEGETYYDVYNNNTSPSDSYGTEDNLIEFVKSGEGNFTYVVGDSMPTVKDDLGNTLGFTFTVDALTEDSATITFTKK